MASLASVPLLTKTADTLSFPGDGATGEQASELGMSCLTTAGGGEKYFSHSSCFLPCFLENFTKRWLRWGVQITTRVIGQSSCCFHMISINFSLLGFCTLHTFLILSHSLFFFRLERGIYLFSHSKDYLVRIRSRSNSLVLLLSYLQPLWS